MKKLGSFIKLVWKTAPMYVVLLVLRSMINGGQLFCNIIFPKYLIEELMGAKNPEILIFWGALIVGSNVLFALINNIIERFTTVQNDVLYHRMNQHMANKIMNLEYSYLEDPYYLDLKERAVFAISNQGATVALIQNMADVLTGIVKLMGLLAIMATLGPVLIVAVIVAIIAMLLMYKGMSDSQVKLMNSIIPINRRYGYYVGLGYSKEVQKDSRLYDMSDLFVSRTKKFTEETCEGFLAFGKKAGVSLGGMNMINDIVAAFCYLYVGIRTLGTKLGSLYLGPQISIGSLTMYVSSAISFSTSVRGVGESIIYMLQVLSYLDPYMEFMALKDEQEIAGTKKVEGGIRSIEFKNVTFTYPKAEKPVLTDVSFSIHQGQKISIVGLNGAGKSTLVKLLCRMYKVDSGEILINGQNIYEYDYEDYMKQVAAVFQDYRLFNFTVEENITCEEMGIDEKKVARLVEEVGLKEKMESLPAGVSTRLGKEYDEEGTEMSGGEKQKIAIARALYKGGSMVILDEPASALDPIAEAEIYEKFNGLVEDKTAIYISHRMSSSVFCDKILIIDGGKVADFDTHENLMKKQDSLYYKLFRSQAENYQFAG